MKKQLIAAAVAASMSAFSMADISITGDAKYEYDHTDTNGTKTNTANTEMHINIAGKKGDTAVVIKTEIDSHGDGTQLDIEDNYITTKVGDVSVKAGNYASSTSGLLGELENGGRVTNKVTLGYSIGGLNFYAGNSGVGTGEADVTLNNNMFAGVSTTVAGNRIELKKNSDSRDSWGIKGSLSGVNYRVEQLDDDGTVSGITAGDATYVEVDTTMNGIKFQYASIDADNATLIDENDSAVFAVEPGAKSTSTGGDQIAVSTTVDGTKVTLKSGSVDKGLSSTQDLDYVQVGLSRALASGATAVLTYTDQDALSGATIVSSENLELELNVAF